MDKKIGKKEEIPTPLNKQGWFKKNLWTILLAIAGVVILFYEIAASWKPLPFATVGSLSWHYWFPILAFSSILYAITELNVQGKEKGVLKAILSVTMFMLFIGAPILGWFARTGNREQKQPEKMALSIPANVLQVPANGDSPRVSIPVGYTVSFTGDGFTTHCIYTNGYEDIAGNLEYSHLSGPVSYVYVHDITGKENIVTYVFVRSKG